MGARPFFANGKQFLATSHQQSGNFILAFLETLSRLRNRVTLDQNIFTAEFIVRIASFRRVSMRLHAVMEIENLSGIAKRFVDVFLCPNVERAFGGLAVPGIADAGCNWAVCIFGGKKSAFLRGHITADVVKNIARD